MDSYIDVDALGQVLLASLLAGVGLVVLFALGMVGLAGWASAHGPVADGDAAGSVVASPVRRRAVLVLAVVCFAVVVGGVLTGVVTILAKS